MKGDIGIDGNRHIIFATDAMLTLLSNAKAWYMDGTFSVVKSPFTQLYSIHVFIRSEGNVKQVPVAFVVMSGKRKRDYIAVFRHLKSVLPQQPAVREIVLDFEKAVWRASSKVFPTASIKGCAFHWSQSVWRKMQEIGLQTLYTSDSGINTYCRKILALPLLPSDAICETFSILCTDAAANSKIVELCAYVRTTWLDSNIWPPTAWSVYKQSVRTNNDCEGWHSRLNRKAQKNNLSFYVLATLLYQEAQVVRVQMRLVSNKKLKRYQKSSYAAVQRRLFALWDEYAVGNQNAMQLLSACSKIYSPAPLRNCAK